MKKLVLSFFTTVLSRLARYWLSSKKPLIIGVTGSVGKTSCRVIVADVLRKLLPQEVVYTSPKNFNSEIGLSLSILWINHFKPTFDWIVTVFFESLWTVFVWSHKPSIIVLEYGIDTPGDMNRLLNIAVPDIALLTTIDMVHGANFPNGKDDIEWEKIQLLKAAKDILFFNPSTLSKTNDLIDTKKTVITYSDKPWEWTISFSDYQLSITKNIVWSSFVYHASGNNNLLTVTTTLTWVHNISYMCIGITIADIILHRKSQPSLWTQQAISIPVTLQPGRFTLFVDWSDDIVVDSTYNSSPASMRTVLQESIDLQQTFFKEYALVVVLWEMRELWDISQNEHKELGKRIADQGIKNVIGVSGDSVYMTDYLIWLHDEKTSIGWVWSNLEAIPAIQNLLQTIKKQNPSQKCIIVFKSSQGEIYLEETIKPFISTEQRSVLPRQEPFWINKKQFSKKLYVQPL